VDLYPIVRNGLLIGAPSYSIKKVERLYGEARTEVVESAAESVVQYAEWRKSGQASQPGRAADQSPLLQELQDYNEKDCQVTEGLHRFLLALPVMQQISCRANRWGTAAASQKEDEQVRVFEKDLEVAARSLLEELPATIADGEAIGPRGISWRLQRLLAQLIDFHEREGKVEWWEFFHRLELTPEEREDDSEMIAAARLERVEALTKQSNGYRYRFDASQPLKLSARSAINPRFALVPLRRDGQRLLPLPHLLKGESRALDLEGVLDEQQPDQVTVRLSHKLLAQLKEAGLPGGDLPRQVDLIPLPRQIYKRMLADLVRLANGWVFEEQQLPPPLLHLLERRPLPQLEAVNRRVREQPAAAAAELAALLEVADGVGLSLQGPPGTGKTTVTAELIAELVEAGQRVAVSSNTHEAINNVLVKVQRCLDARGSDALVVKVASSTSEKGDDKALAGTRAQALREAELQEDPAVLGGTIYTLVGRNYDGAPFDLLVIEEAGQVPVSNLLVLARVARNVLLVGDQQQLSQPNRAAHPGDSGLSCIDYVMQDHAVVPPDRGVFLATSWRMPPPLTQVVSELFYDGQLQAAAANGANHVDWDGLGQGLL
jgi:uncharacterized protein